ncbi:hypothetical protein DACRYDRAFT_113942 [Dacryopinax primogenitus]|uniref:histidine kinase n=1 Tax=Dacryopinax primogenitus (strain DJM 731) TaxID=1858805 RepID=M5GFY0_DACPD|nr:uncharacterized protein DACRYDRAFT_113942 [Dacryopinax primogenitus]EJU04543.1 hypothetical protein DACRYDRAFT_113942 [Dacryopinax primogenitus]
MASTSSPSRPPILPMHRNTPPKPRRRLQFQEHGNEDERPAFRRFLSYFLRKISSPSTGSASDGLGPLDLSESSSSAGGQRPGYVRSTGDAEKEDKEDADWKVDEVVVTGELDAGTTTRADGTTTSDRHSDVASHREGELSNSARTDEIHHATGLWGFLRHRLFPVIVAFFNPMLDSPDKELEFQKQNWYSTKKPAFAYAMYLVLNWVLYLILNRNVGSQPFEDITYYGPFTLFTIPIPVLIAFDAPRKWPIPFQIWFSCAIWYCGMTELIQMKQCGFYGDNQCNNKDFLAMLSYNMGFPAVALFICASRFFTAIFQCISFILMCSLILPDQGIFSRNVVTYALFCIFVQYLSYNFEMRNRQTFILNSQLKLAYRSQQKSQIAETHANNSKRRFVSYIFHEVRVPLNTAALAFQNLKSAEAFKEDETETHETEIHALEASLSMMQQVLDDVLDLQRMDSGRFESSPRPFPLHRAINSMLGNIRVATTAKHINLVVDLDESIDQLSDAEIGERHLWIVGDEIRLRQVVTNLASNAIKFTPENGGNIKVVTKLLRVVKPTPPPTPMGQKMPHMHPLAEKSPAQLLIEQQPKVVFRFEVHDSGPGIKPSDMASSRLFTPFAQTKVGKNSGTKGSGLGLAIVKQIITLSGGRLGVQSRKGQGSCFWFELGYRIATPHEVKTEKEMATSPLPPPPPSFFAPQRPQLADLPELGKESYASSQYEPVTEGVEDDEEEPPNLSPELTTSAGYLDVPVPRIPSIPHQSPSWTAERQTSHASSTMPLLQPTTSEGRGLDKPRPVVTLGQDLKPPTINPSPTSELPLSPLSSVISPAVPEGTDPLRVLVVDDDTLTRTLMTRMLSRLGCVVETAEDGQEALDVLLGSPEANRPPQRFDMISLDNSMPVLSGEEAVRRLRAAGRTDLVVGCTGNALKTDQTSYLSAGADRVLTKPIMLKDLKAMLQIAAQRREEAAATAANPSTSS